MASSEICCCVQFIILQMKLLKSMKIQIFIVLEAITLVFKMGILRIELNVLFSKGTIKTMKPTLSFPRSTSTHLWWRFFCRTVTTFNVFWVVRTKRLASKCRTFIPTFWNRLKASVDLLSHWRWQTQFSSRTRSETKLKILQKVQLDNFFKVKAKIHTP